MALPIYQSSGALSTGFSSVNVGYPSVINADDILLMIVANDRNTPPGVPTGWTLINSDFSSTTSVLSYMCCWKRALGTETGSVTVTTGVPLFGVIHRYSDAITSGSIIDGAIIEDAIGAVARASTSVSISGNSTSKKIYLGVIGEINAAVNQSSVDWTVRSNLHSAYQNDMSLFLADSSDITSTNASIDNVGGGQMGSFAFLMKGSAPASTTEQEGFRFRNDDGSETTATWKDNQDVNITQAKNVATRLRILTDTVNDSPTAQITLQYKRTDENANEWRNV